jgi:rhamnulokinase
MSSTAYLACDLGAESGRVILATLTDGERLTLEEMHRFANRPVRILDSLRWDLMHLFTEIKTGLRKGAAKAGDSLRGVSVDTWGVDYVFFNALQPMLSLPYCYRDSRTALTYRATVEEIGAETIFAETGIQFMEFNTIYQLRADLLNNGGALEEASGFLNIADYLNYLLSGVARAEESLASTTQLYHPGERHWSSRLIEACGLPERIFPLVVPSGTTLGPLREEVADEIGLPSGAGASVEVIASGSHDTSAAVAAVPAAGGQDWAYLVSGTWSLMGMDLETPLLTKEARALNFTNEVGCGGSIRFLKNISGLWILQEAKRDYARLGQDFDYAQIVALAEAAGPAAAFIHPAAERFGKPWRMLEKIAAYCQKSGQPAPENPGQYFRCIFESLALLYRHTLLDAEQLTGRTARVLHIVGGGCQNGLLNRMTADATGRTVLVGPVEATAIGNALIQAMATGEVPSLDALRQIVARSFPLETITPGDAGQWEKAAERFGRLDLLT